MGCKTESFVGTVRITSYGKLSVFEIEGGFLNGSTVSFQYFLGIQYVVEQTGKQTAGMQFVFPSVAAGKVGSKAHQLAVTYLFTI